MLPVPNPRQADAGKGGDSSRHQKAAQPASATTTAVLRTRRTQRSGTKIYDSNSFYRLAFEILRAERRDGQAGGGREIRRHENRSAVARGNRRGENGSVAQVHHVIRRFRIQILTLVDSDFVPEQPA
jgi:hypothetical protein